MKKNRRTAHNSVLPQLAVISKIEAECYYQTFVQVDSVVLRNRQLRQHAKRCTPFFCDTLRLLRFLAFGDKGFIFVQTEQYYGDKNRFIFRRQQNNAQKAS
jgi:hypothetical protein